MLVTDKGGPQEVVEHGKTGFVLPSEDNDAWADTLEMLIADNEKRSEMSRAANAAMQTMTLENSFDHFWHVHKQAWHKHLASNKPDTNKSPRKIRLQSVMLW